MPLSPFSQPTCAIAYHEYTVSTWQNSLNNKQQTSVKSTVVEVFLQMQIRGIAALAHQSFQKCHRVFMKAFCTKKCFLISFSLCTQDVALPNRVIF